MLLGVLFLDFKSLKVGEISVLISVAISGNHPDRHRGLQQHCHEYRNPPPLPGLALTTPWAENADSLRTCSCKRYMPTYTCRRPPLSCSQFALGKKFAAPKLITVLVQGLLVVRRQMKTFCEFYVHLYKQAIIAEEAIHAMIEFILNDAEQLNVIIRWEAVCLMTSLSSTMGMEMWR